MSEFDLLWKHYQKTKAKIARTVGWVVQLCHSWLSQGKRPRFFMGEIPVGKFRDFYFVFYFPDYCQLSPQVFVCTTVPTTGRESSGRMAVTRSVCVMMLPPASTRAGTGGLFCVLDSVGLESVDCRISVYFTANKSEP